MTTARPACRPPLVARDRRTTRTCLVRTKPDDRKAGKAGEGDKGGKGSD